MRHQQFRKCSDADPAEAMRRYRCSAARRTTSAPKNNHAPADHYRGALLTQMRGDVNRSRI
jgi:hypothetical protein